MPDETMVTIGVIALIVIGGGLGLLMYFVRRGATRALNRGVVRRGDHQLQKELTGQTHAFHTTAELPALLDELQRRLSALKRPQLWELERGSNGAYVSYTAFQHSFKAQLLYTPKDDGATVALSYLSFWNTDGVANCVGEMNELLGVVKDTVRALDPQAKAVAKTSEALSLGESLATAQRQNASNKKKTGIAILVMGIVCVLLAVLIGSRQWTSGIPIAIVGVVLLIIYGVKARKLRPAKGMSADGVPALEEASTTVKAKKEKIKRILVLVGVVIGAYWLTVLLNRFVLSQIVGAAMALSAWAGVLPFVGLTALAVGIALWFMLRTKAKAICISVTAIGAVLVLVCIGRVGWVAHQQRVTAERMAALATAQTTQPPQTTTPLPTLPPIAIPDQSSYAAILAQTNPYKVLLADLDGDASDEMITIQRKVTDSPAYVSFIFSVYTMENGKAVERISNISVGGLSAGDPNNFVIFRTKDGQFCVYEGPVQSMSYSLKVLTLNSGSGFILEDSVGTYFINDGWEATPTDWNTYIGQVKKVIKSGIVILMKGQLSELGYYTDIWAATAGSADYTGRWLSTEQARQALSQGATVTPKPSTTKKAATTTTKPQTNEIKFIDDVSFTLGGVLYVYNQEAGTYDNTLDPRDFYEGRDERVEAAWEAYMNR